MAEEEVAIEVEAMQAVYGEDCVVLDQFPPHLHVQIKPRTADVSSQQFVEAVLRIKASSKYPNEPPVIDIIDSKGLDDKRKRHLITSIREKACELSSCLMLVALCEEAVEGLSTMNHPDGNCPLCLYPLFPENKQRNILPFMKLMSCFHCFHSECIIRWWNWLQTQEEMEPDNPSSEIVQPSNEIEQQQGMHEAERSAGNCPVCRKLFHAKDIEHVLSLVGSHTSNVSSSEAEITDDEKLLHSNSEVTRKLRFEAILKLQEENSGLIEPKRTGVIVPGMFLQRRIASSPSGLSDKESISEQQKRDPMISPETSSSSLPSRACTSEQQRNPGRGRHRVRNSRKPVKQWVKKDDTPTN